MLLTSFVVQAKFRLPNLQIRKPLVLKPVDRGWRALNVFNYFDARQQFNKSKTARALADFGLARIYYRTDNPFHQPDSAWKYINLASQGWNLPDKGMIKRAQWYAVTKDSVSLLRRAIIEQAFRETSRLHVVSGWKLFISKYGEHHLSDSANSGLYDAAWKVAISDPSAASLKTFMLEYPAATARYAVKEMYEQRLYRECTKRNSLNEYEAFIRNYPASPYFNEAQDSVYRIATRSDNEEDLYAFIKRFSTNPHKNEAWRRLFFLASGNRSTASLDEFLAKYPDYPFKDDIIQERELAEREILILKTKNGSGVIDFAGNWIIKPEYDRIDLPSDGIFRAEKNGLTGYLDRFGNWIIKPFYEDGTDFKYGSAPVKTADGWFLVDMKGRRLSEVYDELGEWGDSLIPAKKADRYGYLSAKGQVKIPLQFAFAAQFQHGLALVESDNRFGFINTSGMVVVPIVWDWAEPFSGQFARVLKNESYGLINRLGTLVMPCRWDFITPFINRYALAGMDEHCGIVKLLLYAEGLTTADSTLQGYEQVTTMDYDIPIEVETGNPMVEGTFELRKNGKAGIVDTSGTVLLDFIYTDLQAGRGPWFAVKRKGKWVLMSKQKKELPGTGSEMITRLENGFFRIKRKGLWGLMNADGLIVSPLIYTLANPVDEHKVWIAGNEAGLYLLDVSGKELIPGPFQTIKKQGMLYILEADSQKRIYSVAHQKLIFTTEQ